MSKYGSKAVDSNVDPAESGPMCVGQGCQCFSNHIRVQPCHGTADDDVGVRLAAAAPAPRGNAHFAGYARFKALRRGFGVRLLDSSATSCVSIRLIQQHSPGCFEKYQRSWLRGLSRPEVADLPSQPSMTFSSLQSIYPPSRYPHAHLTFVVERHDASADLHFVDGHSLSDRPSGKEYTFRAASTSERIDYYDTIFGSLRFTDSLPAGRLERVVEHPTQGVSATPYYSVLQITPQGRMFSCRAGLNARNNDRVRPIKLGSRSSTASASVNVHVGNVDSLNEDLKRIVHAS
ncbi:hypothetical protein C8Q79DRAFT_928371 [Trametes meyenii]|nr:hypothetical protein C8Q79DRAFT_928371 [Trametes meyenii]